MVTLRLIVEREGKIGIRRELGALTISLMKILTDVVRKYDTRSEFVGHGLVGPKRQWSSGRVLRRGSCERHLDLQCA